VLQAARRRLPHIAIGMIVGAAAAEDDWSQVRGRVEAGEEERWRGGGEEERRWWRRRGGGGVEVGREEEVEER
jgi:hypothetical protein